MTTDHYILDDDHNPIPCDLMTWARMFEDRSKKIVRQTNVFGPFGRQWVSTVFLGLDHNWSDEGPPVLFETMIFGGPENDYQTRYCTWDEALDGHRLAVQDAKWARWNVLKWARYYFQIARKDFEAHWTLQNFQGRHPMEIAGAHLHFHSTPEGFTEDLSWRVKVWDVEHDQVPIFSMLMDRVFEDNDEDEEEDDDSDDRDE